MTLVFGPSDPDFDFAAYEALNLKGAILKGKAGQTYWTVGNTFDYDIVIPKVAGTLGGQFAVQKRDGKYLVFDLSHGGIDS